jgi:hypothetical protein
LRGSTHGGAGHERSAAAIGPDAVDDLGLALLAEGDGEPARIILLRLHGLVERIPKSHRYCVTELGLRAGVFFSRAYARIFRPGLAIVTPHEAHDDCHLRHGFDHVPARHGCLV